MIDVVELSKSYRGKVVVDRLSFRVESGRVTGFLGPNGAGKSTTMRLIVGLDHPTGTWRGARHRPSRKWACLVTICSRSPSFDRQGRSRIGPGPGRCGPGCTAQQVRSFDVDHALLRGITTRAESLDRMRRRAEAQG